jgi:hypothetical protein
MISLVTNQIERQHRPAYTPLLDCISAPKIAFGTHPPCQRLGKHRPNIQLACESWRYRRTLTLTMDASPSYWLCVPAMPVAGKTGKVGGKAPPIDHRPVSGSPANAVETTARNNARSGHMLYNAPSPSTAKRSSVLHLTHVV